jgi:aldose 1-epimerase
MDILTDQPGMVVFNPKNINDICLETQKFSNGPNIPHFLNTILHPNEKYHQKTQYVSQSSKETFGKN